MLTDNDMIAIALRRSHDDEGIVVVPPETYVRYLGVDEPATSREKLKDILVKALARRDYDFRALVDLLFERNQRPVPLTVKSSPETGYLVDYEGRWVAYFEGSRAKREELRKDHPTVHGLTTVSLPAYHPETGVFLIYLTSRSGFGNGWGWVKGFKHTEEKIESFGFAEMWSGCGGSWEIREALMIKLEALAQRSRGQQSNE